ncbi:MAG: class I SAM-dependent methyltransferase [Nitrospirota bacterium]
MKEDFSLAYYLLEREHWWFLARKEILRDQLRKLFDGVKTLKILNVGAAWGASTIMLQEFGEVTSLEYNKICCDYVKQELGIDCVQGNITALPFEDNFFDLVCAFDVVEHVQDDRLAISELHRVCKRGGYTFTTVPTFNFMWSEHDVINEHKRRYTKKSYLKLFSDTDCSVMYRSYFNFWLFFPVATFRVLSSFFKRNRAEAVAQSDNLKINKGWLSFILHQIFRSETLLLRRGMVFPVGVSLMVISNKNP